MKNSFYALAVVAAVVSLGSCKKKDDATPVGTAKIRYFNGVPSNLTLDIYEGTDQTRSDFVFKANTAYTTVPAQSRTIEVNRANSSQKLLTTSVGLDNNQSYTLFLARKSDTDTTLQMIVSKDTLTAANAAKAHIRFINLVPNAPQLILANGSVPMTGISILAYGKRTSFVDFDPASITLNLLNQSFTSIIDPVPTVPTTFEAGKFYTVVGVGRVGETNIAAPAAVVLQHN